MEKKSDFTQKYTMILTVMVALMTTILMTFFIYTKALIPETSTEQLKRLEISVNKLSGEVYVQDKYKQIKEENEKLREMVSFYKEKNEFLQKQLNEIKSQK